MRFSWRYHRTSATWWRSSGWIGHTSVSMTAPKWTTSPNWCRSRRSCIVMSSQRLGRSSRLCRGRLTVSLRTCYANELEFRNNIFVEDLDLTCFIPLANLCLPMLHEIFCAYYLLTKWGRENHSWIVFNSKPWRFTLNNWIKNLKLCIWQTLAWKLLH